MVVLSPYIHEISATTPLIREKSKLSITHIWIKNLIIGYLWILLDNNIFKLAKYGFNISLYFSRITTPHLGNR